jgi:hypothetical protein
VHLFDLTFSIRLTEVHQSQAELLKDYTIMQEMTLRETVTSTIQFGTPLIKTIDKMLGKSREIVYQIANISKNRAIFSMLLFSKRNESTSSW